MILDQLFVTLYALSIYPSRHEQLFRYHTNPYRKFPCSAVRFIIAYRYRPNPFREFPFSALCFIIAYRFHQKTVGNYEMGCSKLTIQDRKNYYMINIQYKLLSTDAREGVKNKLKSTKIVKGVMSPKPRPPPPATPFKVDFFLIFRPLPSLLLCGQLSESVSQQTECRCISFCSLKV